jgi:hypothetical protein
VQPIKRFSAGLFHEMAPAVLFFFVAFLLMGIMFKLFASEHAIEFSAFTQAAVAALLLGKVVAFLDWAESGYRFDGYRRIVVVACKTFVYAWVVIVLGIGERIFKAYREAGSLGEAASHIIANANVDRFLGLVLLISLVVFVYLVMQEIEWAMGKGALFRLFFKRPEPIPEAGFPRTP